MDVIVQLDHLLEIKAFVLVKHEWSLKVEFQFLATSWHAHDPLNDVLVVDVSNNDIVI